MHLVYPSPRGFSFCGLPHPCSTVLRMRGAESRPAVFEVFLGGMLRTQRRCFLKGLFFIFWKPILLYVGNRSIEVELGRGQAT
jgi:hypothetical protein